MKSFSVIRKISLLLLIAPAIFMAGCSKDFDVPDVKIPIFSLPDGATIISIKELKARHIVFGVGAVDSINDNVYVTGKVISSDETGNIYKSLYIQDTSGGLLLSLDASGLYTSYRLGQRIYVKCQGLFLGDYNKMIQLGVINNGEIGRIPAPVIDQYLFLDSLPGPVPAAKVITIPEITADDYGMLVKFENVSFVDVGDPFSDPAASSNRSITDGSNLLILRNSNYATFADQLIPDSTGSVTGILGVFGTDKQLYIRDLNDLIGFDYSSKLIINESFASGSLGTFTQYSVLGDQVWAQSSFSPYTFAKMSGYFSSSYFANEDWLISPSMNFDAYTGETLKFFTMMNYGAVGDGSFKAYYSTDFTSGAPSTGTWIELTGLTLSGGNFDNVSSGDVDVSFVNGSNVHIAFVYTCTTSNVATWELGGIRVKGIQN